MRNERKKRGALFGLALLLIAGSIALFNREWGSGCLGVPFLKAIPDQKTYQFEDFSGRIYFQSQPCAVDREAGVVYISQDIGPDTRYQDLVGSLSIEKSLWPMFFLWEDAFLDLDAAAAQGHQFTLIIPHGKTYMRYGVVFTTLPVLCMEDPERTELTEKYVDVYGSLRLWNPKDPDVGEYSIQQSDVRWKIRGHASTVMPKKSLKLTLLKKSGEKHNLSLLGLGSDDDWILNPMSMDDSNIKEQFTMQLWNELAAQNQWDPEMSTGAYCELILNGRYHGLYLVQRRVDKKYLNLREDQLLFKAVSSISVTKAESGSFSVKYPREDWEESLETLQDLLKNRLEDAIDLRNYADISIFIQLGYLEDNAGFRNLYCLLTPDGESYTLSYTLWDTDMAMGLCGGFDYDYDGTVHSVLQRYEHQRLLKKYPDLDRQIARRWFALRKDLLSEAHIMQLLDDLDRELTASGAVNRDVERWGYYWKGQRTPQEFLRDRLTFLDEYYGSL